ncbi:hypothetical protein [Selenomonas sp. TAMA-11512]|uniref:hypothetical protein n=1 Tax=Selenomonas sp. TAMA-11512 TaxID=3095337 RepID=UPI0030D45E12
MRKRCQRGAKTLAAKSMCGAKPLGAHDTRQRGRGGPAMTHGEKMDVGERKYT